MNKLVLVGLVSFAVLFGCNQSNKADANLPKGFNVVSEDYIAGYQDVAVMQHQTTGCFYVLSEGYESVSLIQMFVEKNGVSVPYCQK